MKMGAKTTVPKVIVYPEMDKTSMFWRKRGRQGKNKRTNSVTKKGGSYDIYSVLAEKRDR